MHALPPGREINVWFDGSWRQGNAPIIGAADHGAWLGDMVFDGARAFEGVAPDLDRHCARFHHSSARMGLKPPLSVGETIEIAREGIKRFAKEIPLYVRPMLWSVEAGRGLMEADPDSSAFALCLEEAPFPSAEKGASMTTTRYVRPSISCALTDAKASCLYPNNARMIREAHEKGFDNAIVCDPLGNVAETASSNIFMAKGGEVFTPVANGTFLAGVTRRRVIELLGKTGIAVRETTLVIEDFRNADEIFTTGNFAKVVPIWKFDEHEPGPGPITRKARELYWEWAHGG